MARKTYYEEFRQFAKEHSNLTSNKMLEAFRETGMGIKKRTGLDILRSIAGIKEGEHRGKTLAQKQALGKGERRTLPNRKTVRTTPYKRPTLTNIDKRNFYLGNRLVDKMYDNITQLTGLKGTAFTQIFISIDGDDYTANNSFAVFLEKHKKSVRSLGEGILKNLKTYYTNLAKRYKGNEAKTETILDDSIKPLMKEFNRYDEIDLEELRRLFETYGIQIKRIEHVTFK